MIQKIGAVNLKGKVYESLKKYILSLNIYLKESDFHLDERQLSEKLGVSRTPIREAVAKLEQEGIVKTVPRRGVFVHRKSKKDLVDIVTVWAGLEGYAAHLIIKNSKKDEIESLNKFCHYSKENVLSELDNYSNDIYNSFSPSVIRGGLSDVSKTKKNEISVLGSIAAGTPIEAIQNEVSRIPLPSNIENNGEFFGLKVKGDSMIEAGISDGDTVIIKKADRAENGKIVVALIDDHEAMLKRIRIKGKTVALESANRNYETKIFGPDRVKVQGVLISLYRNFN